MAKFDLYGKRVFVAGHGGMVGSAIVRRLKQEHCTILSASRGQLDLTQQNSVMAWFSEHKPDVLFIAAGKVGGIFANDTLPAEFIYENLMIEANLIEAAHKYNLEKLLFLGSSCIYPRDANQPISEASLLTAPLEESNQWYAIAKIAGIKMCQAYRKQHGSDFISAMPTNLYGPGDNFHPQYSHVPAALLKRFHDAKCSGDQNVSVWGSGAVRREFLHVDDLADACIFLMKNYSNDSHVNVGTGSDIKISEFAQIIQQTVKFAGEIVYDTTKQDGTPRKVLDVSKINALGWKAKIALETGLERYYQWFLSNQAALRQ